MNRLKICLSLALFVCVAALWVDAKPEPEPRGRKRAFGAGLLGGALAGGVIGNAMARHSMARPAAPAQPQPQPPAKHVTVIETSPPLSNGCYKQTVKEPLPHNPHAYVETVNLICPTVTPPPLILPPASAPAPASPPLPASPALPATPPALGWLSTNASEAVPMMPQPAPLYPVLVPTQQQHQVNVTQPVLQPPPAPAPAPAPATATAPAAATPQVIVLSKKAIYYDKKSRRNAGNTLRHVTLLLTTLTALIAIKM